MRYPPSSSSMATLRIVSINDVYKLDNLPKLQTFLSKLSKSSSYLNAQPQAPSAVLLCGDFLSPSTLSSIDFGRGSVETLSACGITHVCFGNHEADVGLKALKDRLSELKKSNITVVNSNIRNIPPKFTSSASWMTSLTSPYSIVATPCQRVKIALLGLLSDGDNMFRDDTFRGLPIQNVSDTYARISGDILKEKVADFVVPMTHQSLEKDVVLANVMRETANDYLEGGGGVIFGGHEHDLIHETLHNDVQIIKTGSDAEVASLVDFKFDIIMDGTFGQRQRPKLVDINTSFVDLTSMEDSIIVKQIVDKHMCGIQKMEKEIIVDKSVVCNTVGRSRDRLLSLSSKGSRYKQTTIGSFFCHAIKKELDADVAIINGASIKGGTTYHDNKLSYSQLKNELPFPTKMVVVPMKRSELLEAIEFSRTSLNNGNGMVKDVVVNDCAGDTELTIERKGYLQVDSDFNLHDNNNDLVEILQVALPRNLMAGFCNITPLICLGQRLKEQNHYPSEDDYVPALDLVTRYCCKSKWATIVQKNFTSTFSFFEDADLNSDGVLDKHEIKVMMERFLGYAPSDFVVDDMIASIDIDGNGVIDMDEFSLVLARIERDALEEPAAT